MVKRVWKSMAEAGLPMQPLCQLRSLSARLLDEVYQIRVDCVKRPGAFHEEQVVDSKRMKGARRSSVPQVDAVVESLVALLCPVPSYPQNSRLISA